MGEQTILCGMLQTGSILCFDRMVEKGYTPKQVRLLSEWYLRVRKAQ